MKNSGDIEFAKNYRGLSRFAAGFDWKSVKNLPIDLQEMIPEISLKLN